MERKTTYVRIRLTETQMKDLKHRSKPFRTMTNYINQAIKEFSDSTAKDRLETSKVLAELYASLDVKLAHIGGNLNQAMKRINETAQAGSDYSILLKDHLLPRVKACSELNTEIRKMLNQITLKHLK